MLNLWLEEWATTIADERVHGTIHEQPRARFAREQLTPLGPRPPYQYEHVRQRRVPADAVLVDAILTPTREPSLLSSQVRQGPGHPHG